MENTVIDNIETVANNTANGGSNLMPKVILFMAGVGIVATAYHGTRLVKYTYKKLTHKEPVNVNVDVDVELKTKTA